MKLSIITVVYNGEKTIKDAIESVKKQDYADIEYIIVDGASKDGTVEVAKSYGDTVTKLVSEPDDGIFNAMNKGIALATGEVVAILNCDDFYASDRVASTVMAEFAKDETLDCVYGDLHYVDENDTSQVKRVWKSQPYKEGLFQKGWMPAHPTFFVRKRVYDKHGVFLEDMNVSADYELMLRFLEKHKVKSLYIPQVLTLMREGGNSNGSIKNIIKGNLQVLESFKINGLKVPYCAFFLKPLSKIKQLIVKPS